MTVCWLWCKQRRGNNNIPNSFLKNSVLFKVCLVALLLYQLSKMRLVTNNYSKVNDYFFMQEYYNDAATILISPSKSGSTINDIAAVQWKSKLKTVQNEKTTMELQNAWIWHGRLSIPNNANETNATTSTTTSARTTTIALVTHAKVHQLSSIVFDYQLRRWNGPASISIWITNQNDLNDFVKSFQSFFEQTTNNNNNNYKFTVIFHLLLDGTGLEYPINRLRNMATFFQSRRTNNNDDDDTATTTNNNRLAASHFLTLDPGFIPPPNGHLLLSSCIDSDHDTQYVLSVNKTLLIVPAFEVLNDNNDDILLNNDNTWLPNNKQQVQELLQQERIAPYHVKQFSYGHGPVNYNKWVSIRDDTNNTLFYPIQYQRSFEPFVIGSYYFSYNYFSSLSTFSNINNNISNDNNLLPIKYPLYYPSFRGYGYNRLAWYQELHLQGYNFAVLANSFLVEHPKINQNEVKTVSSYTNKVLGKYAHHLKSTYNISANQIHDLFVPYLVIPGIKKTSTTPKSSDTPTYKKTELVPTSTSALKERWIEIWDSLIQYTKNNDEKIMAINNTTFAFPTALHGVDIRRRGISSRFDLSLVTYASINHLDRLSHQIDDWSGPVSVTIHVTNKDRFDDLITLFQQYHPENIELSIHLLFDVSKNPQIDMMENQLLDLAIYHAPTEFILTTKAGYMTSSLAYKQLTSSLQWKDKSILDRLRRDKVILLIPTVTTNQTNLTTNLTTLDQVQQLVKTQVLHIVSPLGVSPSIILPPNNSSNHPIGDDLNNNYDNSISTTSIPYNPNLSAFILTSKTHLPPYGGNLLGSETNRRLWILELHLKRYTFEILHHNNVFLVASNTINESNNNHYWADKTTNASLLQKHVTERQLFFRDEDNVLFEKLTNVKPYSNITYQKEPLPIINQKQKVKAFLQSRVIEWNEIWEKLSHSKKSIMLQPIMIHHIPNAIPPLEMTSNHLDFGPQNDIGLTTHVSVNKVSQLLFQVTRWNGTTSAAIHVPSKSELQIFVKYYLDHLEEFKYTYFHLLFDASDLEYPHNLLRNLALDNNPCGYFFASDVDFVSQPDIYNHLVTHVLQDDETIQALQDNSTVLAVPAFEFIEQKLPKELLSMDQLVQRLPETKGDVQQMVQNGEIQGFHIDYFYKGHGPTNFKKWLSNSSYNNNNNNTNNSSTLSQNSTPIFYPIKYSNGYEPYIIGYAAGTPRYWPNFRGYGLNKFLWLLDLHLSGYKFGTLSCCFTFHIPHVVSNANVTVKKAASATTRKGLEDYVLYLIQDYDLTKDEMINMVPFSEHLVKRHLESFEKKCKCSLGAAEPSQVVKATTTTTTTTAPTGNSSVTTNPSVATNKPNALQNFLKQKYS